MVAKIVLARFFSIFAEAFIIFSVPVLVYTSTNNASLTSLAFGLERLARVISLPISGWVSHKINPLRMLSISDGIRCFFCFLLYFGNNLFPTIHFISLIIPIACALSFFSGAGYVNLEGFVSRNIEEKKLSSVYSKLQFVEQFTYIAAPILVSLLALRFSILQTFIFIAIPFGISFILWLSIRSGESYENRIFNKSGVRDIISYIFFNKKLIRIISLTFMVNIMQGVLFSTAVYIITTIFKQPNQSYASALALSGLVNCSLFFFAPALIRRFHIRTVGLTAFMIAALGLLIITFANNFMIYLIGFLFIIGSEGCFNLFSRFYRAKLLPADGFSRYLGVVLVLNQMAMPIASFVCAKLLTMMSYNIIFGIFFVIIVTSFVIITPFTFFSDED